MRFLSLFSGIEAASCAWLPLGWECVGVAEIEKFPCAVLAHHYPDVLNLGDITEMTEEQIKALGPIDLIVGGFPCQDLSVAGKRQGMKKNETRSGLFYDAIRIVRWARKHNGCRYLLLENVPGIYSSAGGADFACLVNEILGTGFAVPKDRWKKCGVACGPNGLLEWATLDAQYWNLAQRRVRMFALADFGDWQSRRPILFERESVRGYPAPSRKTWERIAPTLDVRAGRSGETTFRTSGGLAVKNGSHWDGDYPHPTLNQSASGIGSTEDPSFTLQAAHHHAVAAFKGGQGSSAGGIGYDEHVSPTLSAADSGTNRTPALMQGNAVRRLTPRECERLQGFPDDYTLIPIGKKMSADGPRYKALGNSMAVPVMSYIGERIQMVEDIKEFI